MQHPIHLHSFLDNFGVCVLCCSHTHSYQCPFPPNELFCDPGGSAYFLGFSLHSSAGYFSLPERLLTALGLLPMWFSLVSLFPSLCSLYHLASFYIVICRPSWLISVFWGASGDSSTPLQTFLMLSISSPWKFEALCPWVSFILDSTLLLNSKVYSVNSMLAYFLLSSVLLPILWKFIAESSVISINCPL